MNEQVMQRMQEARNTKIQIHNDEVEKALNEQQRRTREASINWNRKKILCIGEQKLCGEQMLCEEVTLGAAWLQQKW